MGKEGFPKEVWWSESPMVEEGWVRVKRDGELRRTSPRLADHCGRKGRGYEMKTGQCVWSQCESVLRDGKDAERGRGQT